MTDDPLWRSFEYIVHFYRIRPEKELLHAQVAVEASKALTLDDIATLAQNAGFGIEQEESTLSEIAATQVPAILVFKDGRIRALVPDVEGKAGHLWDPSTRKEDKKTGTAGKDAVTALLLEKAATSGESGLKPRSEEDARWFWRLLLPHTGAYCDVMLASFFINIFAIALPVFTMNVYDRVVPNNANETMFALTVGICIAFLFNFAFKLARGAILERVAARMSAALDTSLMSQLLHLPVSVATSSIGEKSNLFREVQGLRDFFAARLMPAVMDLPFFVLFLVVIDHIAPGLMPVVVAGIAMMFVVNVLAQIPVNSASKTGFRETQSKNAALVEMLSGAETLRLYNAVGEKLLSWKRSAERSALSAQASQHATTVAGDLSLMIMYLVNVFIVFTGVYEIEQGRLSMGGLIACSILVSRAITPVMSLASVAGQLQRSLDSLKAIDRIFKMPAEPALTADYQPKAPFHGKMELRDITFSYPGQSRPTLEKLSLIINPGEKVGIIGRTGAGKSTVLRLLERSANAGSGHLFIDDVVSTAVHPDEWRQSLGVVPQDIFLFAGSLRQNILMGVHPDNVDEEWLMTSLRLSGLDALLHQSGYGADYDVGEGGKRLSGGQKQSLALARALVRKPKILLLDEPTNGMDHTLELAVRGHLQEYCKGRTLVMVTHRTTLLPLVDRLVMVDQGRIVADGPRDKILEKLSGHGGAHG